MPVVFDILLELSSNTFDLEEITLNDVSATELNDLVCAVNNRPLPSLKKISLNLGPFESCEEFSKIVTLSLNCPNLQELVLHSDLNIESLDLSKCLALEKLDLSGSKILYISFGYVAEIIEIPAKKRGCEEDDHETAFTNNLREVNLSYCALKSLVLINCPQLTTLKCNFSKIRDIVLIACPVIKLLDISNATQLESLYMQTCRIKTLAIENISAQQLSNIFKEYINQDLNLIKMKLKTDDYSEEQTLDIIQQALEFRREYLKKLFPAQCYYLIESTIQPEMVAISKELRPRRRTYSPTI